MIRSASRWLEAPLGSQAWKAVTSIGRDGDRSHTRLMRFDSISGRRTGTTVPGIADTLIVKPNVIRVATVIAPANRPASGYDIIRLVGKR